MINTQNYIVFGVVFNQCFLIFSIFLIWYGSLFWPDSFTGGPKIYERASMLLFLYVLVCVCDNLYLICESLFLVSYVYICFFNKSGVSVFLMIGSGKRICVKESGKIHPTMYRC